MKQNRTVVQEGLSQHRVSEKALLSVPCPGIPETALSVLLLSEEWVSFYCSWKSETSRPSSRVLLPYLLFGCPGFQLSMVHGGLRILSGECQ